MSPSSPFIDVELPLALGLEPVDAARQARIAPPLLALREAAITVQEMDRLRRDGELVTLGMRALRRAATCRFLALYSEIVYNPARPWLDLRLVEARGAYGPRRFVPRRLRFPLVAPSLADLEWARLVRRPALLPGADYPIHATATAVRGRVARADGSPVRWARVDALLPLAGGAIPAASSTAVIGFAHADDRGEFLMLLPSRQAPPAAPTLTMDICLRAWGPATPPTPPSPAVARVDPHWDLPLEALEFSSIGEQIAAGRLRPASYTATVARLKTVPLGRTISDPLPFVIP